MTRYLTKKKKKHQKPSAYNPGNLYFDIDLQIKVKRNVCMPSPVDLLFFFLDTLIWSVNVLEILTHLGKHSVDNVCVEPLVSLSNTRTGVLLCVN